MFPLLHADAHTSSGKDKEVTSSGGFLNGADWKSVQHWLGKLGTDHWLFLQPNDSEQKLVN